MKLGLFSRQLGTSLSRQFKNNYIHRLQQPNKEWDKIRQKEYCLLPNIIFAIALLIFQWRYYVRSDS